MANCFGKATRMQASGTRGRAVRIGAVTVDLARERASVGGSAVALTALEFAALRCLIEHRGQPVSRQVLVGQVSGDAVRHDAKMADVLVCRLCRKFRTAGVDRLVDAVWGRGYVLSEGERSAVDAVAPLPRLSSAA